MRRSICVISMLLCLLLLAAAAAPAVAGAGGSPQSAQSPDAAVEMQPDGTQDTPDAAPAGQAVAFPMGTEPGWPVEATSVLLIDRDSGQTLYESGADERTYPASTTKIMTALCVAEAVDDLDGTEVTVRQSVLDKLPDDTISLAGLEKGERMSVRQMLYCLLLPSGNDAAVVLADFVSGSLDAFIERMNEKAAELGCTGTHFASVNGLSGREHYTTARDMARIAEALLQVPDLAEIVRTPVYSLTTNVHKGERLENTNHLIDSSDEYYMPSVIGVKTGSSTLSGRCLISAAEQNGLRLMCIIMGAPYMNEIGEVIEPNPAMVDIYNLYNWAFSAFTKVTLSDGVTPMAVNIEGVGATTATPDGALTAVLPAGQSAGVIQSVAISSELRTPLHKGQNVGEVIYKYGETELARLPLLLNEDLAPIRWWVWPLPIAIGVAVLVVLLRLFTRRPARKKARTPARGGAGTARASAGRPPASHTPRPAARTARPASPPQPRQEQRDYSPFVDYDERPRRR